MLKTSEKLGEILVKNELITREQLEKALEIQRGTKKRIGEVLVELGLMTEHDIVVALGKQLGIPVVSGASGLLNPPKGQGLEELISIDFAKKHGILPLSKDMDALTIACIDPLDLITLDNLSRMTQCKVNPVLVTQEDLEKAIDRFYGGDAMLREAVSQSYEGAEVESPATQEESDETVDLNKVRAEAEDAPVIRLVDLILRQAIKERASDIHIEPFHGKINLRYRIDGVLNEIAPPAKHLGASIASRIKILSKLDIAEKRLPQDGGFRMMMDGRSVDFRVSTVPSIYGEKIVIRILDKNMELLDIGRLGFNTTQAEMFRKIVHSPYGLILVTGPTGSGKSTTLYAALNEINSPKLNILTIEDPVEYRLDGVNQIQVKPQIGLTFAAGLRAFMRQDPDIIMVGETRDLETAEICLRAALTGHLVFSTLHTNDAPSTVSRLADMGVAPFLLSATIRLVVAQRLLRKLCDYCKEAYEPQPDIKQHLKIEEELLYRAKGCEKCSNTGYFGRVGIYEIMTVSRATREIIAKNPTATAIRDIAVSEGMSSLWAEGVKKALDGLTSLEELESVVLLDD